MKYLFKYIKDEIRFILKKKGVLIILLIAPFVLTVWFGGTYYHNYVNDIPMAVLDEDQSSLSRKIIQYFDQNERFNVSYVAKNRTELQELLDKGKVYGGIYIPPNLYEDIQEQKGSSVLILVDGSNVIIGNNIYAGAAAIIQTLSAGVGIQVVEGKGGLNEFDATNMALTFNFNDRLLYDPKMTYMNYLILGFIAVFFQQMTLSAMATLLLRDGEEVAKENTFRRILAKLISTCIFSFVSCGLAVLFINKVYHVEIRGNIFIALLLLMLFALAICGPAVIFCGVFKDKIKFSQFSYMLSLPTFLTCGYVWPLDQMPDLLVIIVKALWPLVNFARPFDEVLFKGVPLQSVLGNMIGLIMYTLIYMSIGIWFFKHRYSLQKDLSNDRIFHKIQSHEIAN